MKRQTILAALLSSLLVWAAGAWAVTPVNINTATVEQLSAGLSGVGEAKARAIVQYREQYGPFVSVEQLTEVKGIGAKLVERNRENVSITVEEAAAKQ